ncbi:thioredoxin domain-containing protein 8 isoform X3 [Equus asinus]|uniref:thioredoxin domain-containing protein 8 isoform X3 n=1 Tax=Equus asinus TaxID=9793 RepID=UPI0038F7712A
MTCSSAGPSVVVKPFLFGYGFGYLVLSCFWLYLRGCTFHPPQPLPEGRQYPPCAACASEVAGALLLAMVLPSQGSPSGSPRVAWVCVPTLALCRFSTGSGAAAPRPTCAAAAGLSEDAASTAAGGAVFTGVAVAAQGPGSCMQPRLLVEPVGSAATGGWVTGSAVVPEASGRRRHPPPLEAGGRTGAKPRAMSLQYQNVMFAKVDVDESRELAQTYHIKAIPTFQMFKQAQKDCREK